jgi:hypothetical protein
MKLNSLCASLIAAIALALLGTIATPALAQTTYPGQYVEVNCPSATSGASVSFTNATPTVGTWASPPWSGSAIAVWTCPITITANPPTGLSSSTNYWIVPISVSAGTFNVATSAANALAGTFVATTGASSTANLTSTLALTTTAGLPTAGVSLPAGDWDCMGSTFYVPATSTSVTNLQQGISQTATTIGNLGTYTDFETAANVLTGTNDPVFTTPYVRQALSAVTSVYNVSLATFTVAALTATGHMHCRKNALQG